MDPENIDVGVIAEEFGHAAFGLPDIYTTDAQASPSNWAIFEAGSWNGILGGMQPAPFPLVFRYMVGWAKPVEMDYTTMPRTVKVGQLSLRPKNTEQGIKINLPDTVIDTPNRAGTGKAWWSDRADLADFYLAHDFDLAGTTAPVFSFASFWSFEADYDYGYFEVSEDGGATWTLAGFQGRAVTGIAQSSATGSLILVAVDDAIGLARLAARNQAAVLDGVQRLLLTLSHVSALRDRDPAGPPRPRGPVDRAQGAARSLRHLPPLGSGRTHSGNRRLERRAGGGHEAAQ